LKLSCREGEFKMLKPARSLRGGFLVGAIVGSDKKGMTYVTRVEHKRNVLNELLKCREKILKDHPGIKEIFGDQ
jgi:hypothetical protein